MDETWLFLDSLSRVAVAECENTGGGWGYMLYREVYYVDVLYYCQERGMNGKRLTVNFFLGLSPAFFLPC